MHDHTVPRGTDARRHAVVIGSGFGGLAAAVRLGAKGYRVTVLERRDAAGGRAYVIHDQGFVFDSGPTIITAPFLFEDLWRLAGRKLEDDVALRRLTPAYELRFSDGYRLSCFADAALMRADATRTGPAVTSTNCIRPKGTTVSR